MLAEHAAPKPREVDSFRRDINGLRAIAVLLVVLYHADLPVLPGGYVGVDVFFVISGFLITGLLAREVAGSGTIRLVPFWARRIRRLLPAAALVLVVTLLAGRLLLPPLEMPGLAADARATALYVANMWFAWTGIDYLADDSPSPLLHYWSLAVEEQFYLFWPILMLVAIRLGRRHRSRAMLVAVVAVVVISFGLCVVLTGPYQPFAFFGLPTRAWELAAGGLLALVVRAGWTLPRRAASASSWLGLTVILLVAVTYSDSTAFPGAAAALPVVGTMILIAGGSFTAGGATRLLGLRPFQRLGDWSYSLYLWHWSLLVIPAMLSLEPPRWWERAGLVVLAVVLAATTHRHVENRFRAHGRLTRRQLRTYGFGVTITAAALVASVAAAILPPLHTNRPASSLGLPIEVEAAPEYVPSNLQPRLATVDEDLPRVYADGCHLGFTAVEAPECVYGEVGSDERVVLMGDSHAAQWFPALEQLAAERGFELVSATKSACPSVAVTVVQGKLKRTYHECDRWRERVLDRLTQDPPAVLVLSNHREHVLGSDSAVTPEQWAAGLTETINALPESTRVVVLGDTPEFRRSVPVCLSDHLADPRTCAEPRHQAVPADHEQLEAAAVTAAGGTYVATYQWLCPGSDCQVLHGDLLLYRDRHHLTTTAAAGLSDVLGEVLRGS